MIVNDYRASSPWIELLTVIGEMVGDLVPMVIYDFPNPG